MFDISGNRPGVKKAIQEAPVLKATLNQKVITEIAFNTTIPSKATIPSTKQITAAVF